jgi:hypothetical protein
VGQNWSPPVFVPPHPVFFQIDGEALSSLVLAKLAVKMSSIVVKALLVAKFK